MVALLCIAMGGSAFGSQRATLSELQMSSISMALTVPLRAGERGSQGPFSLRENFVVSAPPAWSLGPLVQFAEPSMVRGITRMQGWASNVVSVHYEPRGVKNVHAIEFSPFTPYFGCYGAVVSIASDALSPRQR